MKYGADYSEWSFSGSRYKVLICIHLFSWQTWHCQVSIDTYHQVYIPSKAKISLNGQSRMQMFSDYSCYPASKENSACLRELKVRLLDRGGWTSRQAGHDVIDKGIKMHWVSAVSWPLRLASVYFARTGCILVLKYQHTTSVAKPALAMTWVMSSWQHTFCTHCAGFKNMVSASLSGCLLIWSPALLNWQGMYVFHLLFQCSIDLQTADTTCSQTQFSDCHAHGPH